MEGMVIPPTGIEIIASTENPIKKEDVTFEVRFTPGGATGKIRWYVETRNSDGDKKTTEITSEDPISVARTFYVGNTSTGGSTFTNTTYSARLSGNKLIASIYSGASFSNYTANRYLYIIAEICETNLTATKRVMWRL